jgi:predicted transposase/invertase (TIGR01784 family)
MRPGIDPKVDYAFKKVFGSTANIDLLISLINAVLSLPTGREVVALEIRNPFNEKETAEDKLSVLDVKARDASGRLFLVEMQMLAPQHFRNRVLYYWARAYSEQLAEGNEFRDLRPAISICFVANRLFPQVSAYHQRFVLADQATGEVLSEQIEVHLIELQKFTLAARDVKTPLEAWCYFLVHGEELDTAAVPAPLSVAPVNRALEVLNVMTQSELERERYESRLKAIRDENDRLYGAREEGRKEGRKEGLDKGALIGQIRLLQRMLKQTQQPIEELDQRSLEDLTRLADELEKQALPPGT